MGLRRSILFKFAGEAAGRLTAFVIVIIVARRLGPQALGIYALGGSLALYIAIIPDFGMHLFVTREIAAGSTTPRRLVGALLTLKVIIGMAAGALLWIIIPSIFASREEAYTIAIMGTAGIFFGVIEFFTAVLRGYHAIITESTLVMLVRVSRAVTGAIVLVATGSLIGFALAFAIVTSIGAVAALFLTTRRFVAPQLGLDWKKIKSYARQYLTIGTGLIGTFLYFRSDLFIIRFFRTPVEVGWYDAAYRTFEAVQVIPAVIVAVLYPRFAADKGTYFMKRALRAVAIISLVLMTLIFLYGRLLIKLAYGKEFGESVEILKVFYAILPVVFVNHVLTNYLIAIGRQWVYTRTTLIAFALSISINLLAIPQLGMKAAAYATIPTHVFILISCLAAIRISHKATKTQSLLI